MNKSMMFMMLACLGMVVIPYLVPTGWLSGGIGFLLLVIILLACCLPMIKMMMKGERQECETMKDNVPEGGEIVQGKIHKDDA